MPCPGMSEAEIKQRVTAPGVATPNKPLWGSQVPLPDASQGCNSYLPNGQVIERFKWVVQHCVSAGERPGPADSARWHVGAVLVLVRGVHGCSTSGWCSTACPRVWGQGVPAGRGAGASVV